LAFGILWCFSHCRTATRRQFLTPEQNSGWKQPWRRSLVTCAAHFLTTEVVCDIRMCAVLLYFAIFSANLSLAFFLPQIIARGTTLTTDRLADGYSLPRLGSGLVAIGRLSDHFANHRALLLASLLITATGLFAAAQFGAGGAFRLGIVALAFASIGISWPQKRLSGPGADHPGRVRRWLARYCLDHSVGNLGGFFGPSIWDG